MNQIVGRGVLIRGDTNGSPGLPDAHLLQLHSRHQINTNRKLSSSPLVETDRNPMPNLLAADVGGSGGRLSRNLRGSLQNNLQTQPAKLQVNIWSSGTHT